MSCPQLSLLHHTLSNGTAVTFCGIPFDSHRVCGFYERDPTVGVQMCCAVVNATGLSRAICEFTIGQRVGQLMEVLAAMFTTVAVGGLLVYAAYRRVRRRRGARHHRSTDAIDSSLFMNLMVAEFIQAFGNLFTIRWIAQGYIGNEDPVCTAQGGLKQIGIVLTALTSLAISVQTFYVLVFRWPIRRSHSRWIISGLWSCVVLDVAIPNIVHRNADFPYYGSTGFWCWIYPTFMTEQIVTEYLYIWIAAFVMLVLYGVMFTVMHGYLVYENGSFHWQSKTSRDNRSDSSSPATPDHLAQGDPGGDDSESKAVAKMLLLYPAVYMFSIVPISITRWMQFRDHKTPYQATLFSATIFALAGFFNVILFCFTRPELVRGGSDETLPALPTVPAGNSAHSQTDQEKRSPDPSPLQLRNISFTNERDEGDSDYGHLPPL